MTPMQQLQSLFTELEHTGNPFTKGEVRVEYDGKVVSIRAADLRHDLRAIRTREADASNLSKSLRRVINDNKYS